MRSTAKGKTRLNQKSVWVGNALSHEDMEGSATHDLKWDITCQFNMLFRLEYLTERSASREISSAGSLYEGSSEVDKGRGGGVFSEEAKEATSPRNRLERSSSSGYFREHVVSSV